MMKYKAHVKLVDGVIVVRTFVNTVGAVAWERVSAGVYNATLPDNYGVERIHLPNRVLDIDLEGESQATVSIASANTIQVAAQTSVGDHTDWLSYTVEFEVYPTSSVQTFE